MKVNAVNIQTFTPKHYGVSKNVSTPPADIEQKEEQKVYAANLGFRGGKQLSALMSDYKWFMSHDKIPAINSFLKIDAPAENMESLIRHILSDKTEGYNFIDSIISQPRQIKHIAKALKEKLPQSSDILNIFSYGNPYRAAHENYIATRVQNASSVSELLKIRPDWNERILLEKHRELYHNDDFELGIIPDSIGRDNYHIIVDYLRTFADIGFKTKKEISDLNINGQVFKFENFVDGKSDKNVFKVTTPSGESFIIKMAAPETRGLNNPFALGTLAMIDTYLTRNNCRNSAPIRYYHHNSNTAVYEFIKHNTAESKLNHLNEFVINMPDFADLGLNQNDTVGTNNYFKLEKNQDAMKHTYDFQYGVEHNELVSVDNDHVTYDQSLCPVDYNFNKPLPCAMQMFF
mgnify:CR=1 FL=1